MKARAFLAAAFQDTVAMKTLFPAFSLAALRWIALGLLLCLGASRIARGQGAGSALQFDGVNDEASSSLPAKILPITLTAWVKTSQTFGYDGVLGATEAATGNGFGIAVVNGRITAWYNRDAANRVATVQDPGDPAIADDTWHHIAFVAEASGARLYLDGALIKTAAWNGTAGVITTNEPLHIGRYSSDANTSLAAEIDQVSIWDVALTDAQIASRYHFDFSGHEPGLQASWNFNEGSGTDARSVGQSVFGSILLSLAGGAVWVASGAPIGPAPVAITSVVSNVPGGAATLRGVVNPRGEAATAFFEWGVTTAYGSSTPATAMGAGTSEVPFTAELTGLAPNIFYHYRIVVTNAY